MKIVLNTKLVRDEIINLNNASKAFSTNTNRFASFNNTPELTSHISKISNSFSKLSSNLNKVTTLLDEYIYDIELIEKKFSEGSYSMVYLLNGSSTYVPEILRSKIANSVFHETSDFDTQVKEDMKEFWAEGAVCALAFTEGIVNVAEMLTDGVAWIGFGACSLVDWIFDTNSADAVANYIKYDWSKEGYYWIVDETGLGKYADPNSAMAQACSIAGNVVGTIALTIVTGGLAAGAYGAGTAAAVTATKVAGGVTGALMASGRKTEESLKMGASNKEALISGGIEAAIGFVSGQWSGQYDAMARAGKGIGCIFKSGLVGFTEEVVLEAIDSATWQNDGESGFFKNFFANAKNDGLLMAATLNFITNAGGTAGNYRNSKIKVGNDVLNAEISKATSVEGPLDMNLQFFGNNQRSFVSRLKSVFEGNSSNINDINPKTISEIDLDAEYKIENRLESNIFKKYKNAQDLYEKFIKGKTGMNMQEYAINMQFFNVRDGVVLNNKTGLELEKIFFDDDYIIGVHRTGIEGDPVSIMENGLNLTGHLSSGATGNKLDLSNNITFHTDYADFINAISQGATYKTGGLGRGSAVIVKIPKVDIDNFDKIINTDNVTPVLKPTYIVGSVDSSVTPDGKIKFLNSNFLD